MATNSQTSARSKEDDLPVIAVDLPVMYEDEGQEEMGESEPHTLAGHILATGLSAHFAGQPDYRVFSNLNLYYHRLDPNAYVSPDTMVVRPLEPHRKDFSSYRIGQEGPAPDVAIEVLSRRSYQQQDLTNKPDIYADLGVPEYILVDMTGEFLPKKLLLKRLQPDGTWKDQRDRDGGVTSQLEFRLLIEKDGLLRVIDASTAKRYVRPEEGQHEADARRQAAQRVCELENELDRLRKQLGKQAKDD